MGSRGKLCFCTTISSNAFWGSLLSVIDGWLKLVGTHIVSCLGIPGLRQILQVVSCRSFYPHEIYEFIVMRTSRDRKFPEKKKVSARHVVSWYKIFSHSSTTNSKQPQNAVLLIVVQKQSFPREPILLYSRGLINKVKRTPLRVQTSWVGLWKLVQQDRKTWLSTFRDLGFLCPADFQQKRPMKA